MGNLDSCVCLHESATDLHKSQDWTAVSPLGHKARGASDAKANERVVVALDVVESRRLAHSQPEPTLKRLATQKSPLTLAHNAPATTSSPNERRPTEIAQIWHSNEASNKQNNHMQLSSTDRLFTSQPLHSTSPDRATSKHLLDMTFRDPNTSNQGQVEPQHFSSQQRDLLTKSIEYRTEHLSDIASPNLLQTAVQSGGINMSFAPVRYEGENPNPGYDKYAPIQISYGREGQFKSAATPSFSFGLGPGTAPPMTVDNTNNLTKVSQMQEPALKPLEIANKLRQTLMIIESKKYFSSGQKFIQASNDLEA